MAYIYALRVEQAVSVIGRLAPATVNRSQLQSIYDHFVRQLTDALSDCSREPVRIEMHAYTELEQKKATLLEPGLTYINFDSQSCLGIPFGVSRLFDFTRSRQVGISSRPGYDELALQIGRLQETSGDVFGIIEDDIYSGGTLQRMLELFAKTGITVRHIVSGISSTRVINDRVPVSSAVYYAPKSLLELTDPRDYLFGAQEGGLVVTLAGKKARLPYDHAFVDITSRSSISPHKVDLFSERVRAANRTLHAQLKTLNYPAALFYPESLLQSAGFAPASSIGDLLNIIS